MILFHYKVMLLFHSAKLNMKCEAPCDSVSAAFGGGGHCKTWQKLCSSARFIRALSAKQKRRATLDSSTARVHVASSAVSAFYFRHPHRRRRNAPMDSVAAVASFLGSAFIVVAPSAVYIPQMQALLKVRVCSFRSLVRVCSTPHWHPPFAPSLAHWHPPFAPSLVCSRRTSTACQASASASPSPCSLQQF
jgi:hypothetical protein